MPRQQPDRHAGEQVGEHDREQKALHAHLQLRDEDDVEDEERQRTRDAVGGIELDKIACACKLRRDLPEAGDQHIAREQRHKRADVLIEQQQGREQQKARASGEQHGHGIGEDGLALIIAVEPVADDRVSDREADDRDQQIGAHFEHLFGVEERRGKVCGIEARQHEGQQLRAEAPDRKDHRVEGEPFVFVHGSYPFPGNFPGFAAAGTAAVRSDITIQYILYHVFPKNARRK